jgi:porin
MRILATIWYHVAPPMTHPHRPNCGPARHPRRWTFHLALSLILATATAPAQTAAPRNPGVPPVTDSGTVSGNNLHPKTTTTAPAAETNTQESPDSVNLRPFIFVLPRDHFLGDWLGVRTTLENDGITPTLTYIADISGNVSGGKNQGVAYADNIGLNLLFDLKKLAGIDGGSFLVSMAQRDGTSLTQTHLHNAFTTQQDFGGETFHLIDIAYQQQLLDDRVEFRIGRISAGDDFLVSKYDYLFEQNGFDGNPVGIFLNAPGMSAYPAGTWGALVKAIPTRRTYIMGAIYNGDANIRLNQYHGANFSMDGPVFAIGEMGYRCNGLPGDSQYLGDYKIGGWYDDSLYTSYTTGGMSRGNWGVYALFDQVVLPFGEMYSNRGLGIFGSVLLSPDKTRSELPYFFTAGFAWRGISEARPTDMVAAGIVYGEFSDDLRASEQREAALGEPIAGQGHEAVMEWMYRFNFDKRRIFFQPDVQYVIHPDGTETYRNAVVLGCQIGINF